MKILAIIFFSVFTWAASSYFGLSFVDDPVMYSLVNFPVIACFVTVVNMLPDKGVTFKITGTERSYHGTINEEKTNDKPG